MWSSVAATGYEARLYCDVSQGASQIVVSTQFLIFLTKTTIGERDGKRNKIGIPGDEGPHFIRALQGHGCIAEVGVSREGVRVSDFGRLRVSDPVFGLIPEQKSFDNRGQPFRLVVMHHVPAVRERLFAEIPECVFALGHLRRRVFAPAA